MAGLLAMRDALAQGGEHEAAALGARLGLAPALASALLEQLVQLGLARRLTPPSACGDCSHCPSAQGCRTPLYCSRAQLIARG